MTDANPFDDLSEVESDESDDESADASGESQSASSDDSVRSSVESSTDPVQTESPKDTSTDSVPGPSFEYAEVRQRPLYARGETWDEFEDAVGIAVVPELRRQGIRDEEKREIHDAVLTLAAEEPERLVEIIAERRQQ